MEMNKKLKNYGALEIMELPAAAVTQLFYDLQILAKMHQDLIQMLEEENALRKQHRASLHVRKQAEEMCQFNKKAIQVILDHYENPKKYMDQAIDFHNMLQEEHKEQDSNSTVEKEKEQEELDVFNLPHDMVMMSVKTLNTMQDDMLSLTTAVETLVDAFAKIEREGGYHYKDMHDLTDFAAKIAKDVFLRWDDAALYEVM